MQIPARLYWIAVVCLSGFEVGRVVVHKVRALLSRSSKWAL